MSLKAYGEFFIGYKYEPKALRTKTAVELFCSKLKFVLKINLREV